MAVQSVVPCAHDPREVLRKLNHILFGQLGGQFATGAYLWVDMEIPRALYSAAGHPPLLCWRDSELKRIESNGPLFGFVADTDYPVCDVPLCTGDRLLLYTDGLIEPENRSGESFGERKLEQVLRNNRSRPPVDFLAQLLTQIASWQPASVTQQDDITLVVIDVI